MALASTSFLSRGSFFALLILLLPAAAAQAQDTSERPEGVVCRAPECDLKRSLPRNLSQVPLERQDFYVELVQNTPAIAFDRALSAVPFDVWLLSALQGYRWAGPGEPFAFWSLSYCDSPLSAFPLAGEPDLCVEVTVPVVGERTVHALIRVAVVDTSKVAAWRDIQPEVHDIYVTRLLEHAQADSLDVPSLSAIHARLALAPDDWPTIDLTPTVTWTPARPSPGALVRFTITVANLGRRDAIRAHVTIYIAIPLNNEDQKELRREWWPRIPAGKAVSFDISATLGRGDAIIVVNANANAMGPKREREVNGEDNEVIALIPWSP